MQNNIELKAVDLSILIQSTIQQRNNMIGEIKHKVVQLKCIQLQKENFQEPLQFSIDDPPSSKLLKNLNKIVAEQEQQQKEMVKQYCQLQLQYNTLVDKGIQMRKQRSYIAVQKQNFVKSKSQIQDKKQFYRKEQIRDQKSQFKEKKEYYQKVKSQIIEKSKKIKQLSTQNAKIKDQTKNLTFDLDTIKIENEVLMSLIPSKQKELQELNILLSEQKNKRVKTLKEIHRVRQKNCDFEIEKLKRMTQKAQENSKIMKNLISQRFDLNMS